MKKHCYSKHRKNSAGAWCVHMMPPSLFWLPPHRCLPRNGPETVTGLDLPKPKKSPESSRAKDLCSSVREWSQLQELVGILATLSLSNRPGTELSLCVVLPVSSYSASSSSVYLMRLITWSDQWTHLRSDPCAVFKGSLLNVRMDGWPSSTCSRLPIW